MKDEVGSASEDAAKEASDGKEGSEKPKDEDEDAEATREEAQDTEAEDLNSGLAQTEETSELPHGEPPVWTDTTVVTAGEEGTGV